MSGIPRKMLVAMVALDTAPKFFCGSFSKSFSDDSVGTLTFLDMAGHAPSRATVSPITSRDDSGPKAMLTSFIIESNRWLSSPELNRYSSEKSKFGRGRCPLVALS